MINSHRILIVLFLLSFATRAQMTYDYDTLSFNERMLGSVDSSDVKSGFLPSTFDGGLELLSQQGFSLNRLNNDFGGVRFNQDPDVQKMRFSALPFIGFAYSFGGQGTQFVRANYIQAFTDSLLLNVDYKANVGNGFLRQSAFISSRVNVNLEWKTKRYGLKFTGGFYSDSLTHNGGIRTDTLIESFGLAFTPIRKLDAASSNKYAFAGISNYFAFNSESPSRVGVVTNHHYDIRYRAYHEVDSLDTVYTQINIDPLLTYDRYNLARIQNSAGFFFAQKNKYIDAQVGHTYWSYLNLGRDNDTSEIDIKSSLRWNFGRILIENQLKINLLGGFGAFLDHAKMSYDRAKWNLNASLGYENTAPTPHERNYFANNYSYNLTGFGLENRLSIQAGGNYKLKGDSVTVGGSVGLLSITDAYLFNGSFWNREGVMNAIQVGINGQFLVGKFHFHPHVVYSNQAENYLPTIQCNARIFFKSTVFKAKRLLLLIGVDASYHSGFQPRNYIPSMDAYTWNQPTNLTNGMVNAHFFTTIEMSTFRFFVRYENIGYFWTDQTLLSSVGYPIAGQRIRLGLTWTFFN